MPVLADPRCAPRDAASRLGWLLLRLGVVASFAAIPFSIALLNAGLATALAGALLMRLPLHRQPATWFGLGLAAWMLLAVALALADGRVQADQGWLKALRQGTSGALYVWLAAPLAEAALSDPRTRAWALRLLIAATVASLLVSLLQLTVGLGRNPPLRIDLHGRRWVHGQGFFGIHLTQGCVMAAVAMALAAPASWLGIPVRWVWAGRIASWGAALASNARIAMAGLVAGTTCAMAACGRRALLLAVPVSLALLLVSCGVLYILDHERMRATLRGEDGRWPIWRTASAMVGERPLFGMGGRQTFRAAYNQEFDRANPPGTVNEFAERDGAPHAHNSALSLSAMYGIPAAVLFHALLAAVLVAAWRRGDPVTWRTALAITACWLAASLFEDSAQDGESAHALFLLLGLALAWRPALAQPSGG